MPQGCDLLPGVCAGSLGCGADIIRAERECVFVQRVFAGHGQRRFLGELFSDGEPLHFEPDAGFDDRVLLVLSNFELQWDAAHD